MEEEIIGEFEVSFNFKNVLYVCQILPAGNPQDPYYRVEYFSPNGRGIIQRLVLEPPTDGNHTRVWKADDEKADPEFIQELGRRIEKNHP
jgi:hypothetical protein